MPEPDSAPNLTDPATTIRDRMLAAGLAEEKTDAYLQSGAVRINGEPVTDPNHPAPRRARRPT
jgi:hypothetical protein